MSKCSDRPDHLHLLVQFEWNLLGPRLHLKAAQTLIKPTQVSLGTRSGGKHLFYLVSKMLIGIQTVLVP